MDKGRLYRMPTEEGQGKDASGITRRQFFADIAGGVGLGAVLTLGAGLYARQAQASPAYALRPPGALTERDFLAACARCGQCVRDCPYHILRLGSPGDGVPTGTPYFVAREGGCEMCEGIPCLKACPTGALDSQLNRIDDARMGLAVLVDHETCLNHLGLRCDVCYRTCPLIDEAITLDIQHNRRSGKHSLFIPVVHSEFCTGCGKCERACVLEVSAIKVFPLEQAKGELGRHYRLGWEEKDRAGGPIIPDVLQLPVRRPGGGP